MTNEEKLNGLKKFLEENNVRFFENHHSTTFNIDMALKVRKVRIAVFLSNGNKDEEKKIVNTPSVLKGFPLNHMYNPFFIRESDTMDFVIEKMQNCLVNRMLLLQKRWEKKNKHENKV